MLHGGVDSRIHGHKMAANGVQRVPSVAILYIGSIETPPSDPPAPLGSGKAAVGMEVDRGQGGMKLRMEGKEWREERREVNPAVMENTGYYPLCLEAHQPPSPWTK